MLLKLEPISAERFAPFGHLIEQAGSFGRIDYVASIDNGRSHARANLATVRLQPTPLPVTIPRLEKHAYSTQAFIPLDVQRFCSIVAPDKDGAPDMSAAIAFVVPSGTGISYRLGTWHTGMMVLDQPGSLAILTHEDGSSDDCTFYPVEPFQVTL
jgi:ureidoglycolate lyase